MSANDHRTLIGHVAQVWRYPVKSMQGERTERLCVGPGGLEGDRRYAVIDAETGRVASAKNPRKWASLLAHSACLQTGSLVITTPEGSEHRSDRDDLNAVLSRSLGRAVTLSESPTSAAAIEIEWPLVPGLAGAGTESIEGLFAGGFCDVAPVHVLTTATLAEFRRLEPASDFDIRRFRPNILIETLPGLSRFVENDWVGRVLVIGSSSLRVTTPCSRCVMTTLTQPHLSADPRVLRAVVGHNAGAVGVYAAPDRTGEIAEASPVWLM